MVKNHVNVKNISLGVAHLFQEIYVSGTPLSYAN